ncbi:MAG: hypothetical protein AB7I41_00055 [Candidatus Sericytochromatia bacterium]
MVLSSTLPLILDYLPEKFRWLWEESHTLRRLAEHERAHFLLFSDLKQTQSILPLEEFFQSGLLNPNTETVTAFLCLKSEKGIYVLFLAQTEKQEVEQTLENVLTALKKIYPFSPDPELESQISDLLLRAHSLKYPSRLGRLVNHHLQAVQPESDLFQPQDHGPLEAAHPPHNPLDPLFWQDELKQMETWVKQLQATQFQEAYHSARARWKEARRILEEHSQSSLRLRDTERVCLLFVQVGELVRHYFWQNNHIQNPQQVAANWICQVITQAINAAAESTQNQRLLRLAEGLKTALNELREAKLNPLPTNETQISQYLNLLKALGQDQYPLTDLLGVLAKALALAVADRATAAQEKQPIEKGSLQECLQASIFLELSQFTQGDIDLLALHRASVLLAQILYARFFEPIPLPK